MPISGGTVTVLKDADGETQYSPNVTKTFVVDIQDHKLSCNDVHGFSPRARVTITGGKDSQIDTVTADQYVNVTLASTFQGTITTLNATDGNLTVQPGCTAHVKKLQSTYNSTKRIQLMGGSYDKIDINASGLKLGNLLETGYRFESTDTSTERDLYYGDSLWKNRYNLKVVPCTSHSYENGFCKYCNEECPHTTVENNQCTICGLAMVATVTADGETAYYSALQTALNAAADGAEVKLLADVSDAATISSKVTLDLCGKDVVKLTVSAAAKLTDSVGGGVISTLTVADSIGQAAIFLRQNGVQDQPIVHGVEGDHGLCGDFGDLSSRAGGDVDLADRPLGEEIEVLAPQHGGVSGIGGSGIAPQADGLPAGDVIAI